MDPHLQFIELALAEAEKCIPSPTAFCVGCVLVARWPSDDDTLILSSGYSRELPGNTHAEANALTKAKARASSLLSSEATTPLPSIDELLRHADVYTTMEPCSIRTSGLPPCADALIAAKVKRCYIGVSEPDDFVQCEGASKLVAAGIQVVWVKGLEERCLEVARRQG
ncbi:hypothetical protein SISSUDRAFT_1057022 [Sistotremastrum suecicum HHB10207 ss-3]|uniref:CMP/dCMP-type deaminase domain-containing protein n=1 Tax=Sistotremastrum suecicum HHB10207 ss-3 TaxID=1314776 RepID=A0A166IS44_9AGAM|nr:hypothetical protein SISSUDRAFT_1057022 [Sistotremastrum suecicum HHB10207 ss-3]